MHVVIDLKQLDCGERPWVEYASSVWSPHLVKDIKCIDDVQKFALRVCTIGEYLL